MFVPLCLLYKSHTPRFHSETHTLTTHFPVPLIFFPVLSYVPAQHYLSFYLYIKLCPHLFSASLVQGIVTSDKALFTSDEA